jgi:hypothetical protein
MHLRDTSIDLETAPYKATVADTVIDSSSCLNEEVVRHVEDSHSIKRLFLWIAFGKAEEDAFCQKQLLRLKLIQAPLYNAEWTMQSGQLCCLGVEHRYS